MTPNLFKEEQAHIPGLERAGTKVRGRHPLVRNGSPSQLPLMMPVRDETDDRVVHHIPGQLSLHGPNQMELVKASPGPVQLALLPEPPPWELPDEPAPARRPGRLKRSRSKSKISPGQTSLF
jgi:hypothetical protein